MTFAEKLKEMRLAAGMTQAALAEVSAIPLGTIRDYEQGRRDPLLSNAQRLAGALGVSLDLFPSVVPAAPPAPKRRRRKQ